MVRLPVEYQEVEYLESTRAQFIELNFGFDPTDEVEIRGSMENVFGDKYMVAAITWNNDNNRFAMLGGVSNTFVFAFGSQGTPNSLLQPSMPGDTQIHTMIYSNKVFTVVDTGSVADMTSKTFGSTTANLRLFYGYNSNTRGKIAFYHHKKADGTEVNLIPCYHKSSGEIGMYDTVSKQFYTNSGTGTFLKGNDVTYDNINLLESRRRILLNTPHIETISDTIASFKTDVATKLKECKIHFTPIQEGEGDPSPENVRPIHGWDGITVTKCGKNIANLNENDMLSYSWTKAFPNPFKKAGRYTISCQNDIVANNGNTGAFVFLGNAVTDSSGYGMTSWVFGKSVMSASFNITAEALTKNYIVFRFNGYPTYAAISNAQIQIEEGSEPTDYEPYTATTLTIPFPQTIYGGYVDLVNGEVVEEYNSFILDGENYKFTGASSDGVNTHDMAMTYNYIGYSGLSNLPKSIATANTIYSSSLPINVTANIQGVDYNCIQTYSGTGNRYLRAIISKNELSDVSTGSAITSSINEWFSNNPTQIVYKLATPNTYTLTPQTLKALKGINNIWSDANGNIEVSFYTH